MMMMMMMMAMIMRNSTDGMATTMIFLHNKRATQGADLRKLRRWASTKTKLQGKYEHGKQGQGPWLVFTQPQQDQKGRARPMAGAANTI